MEVLPGIHRLGLPLPMPSSQLTNVNAYLIQGDDGWLLIDTGWKTRSVLKALEDQLKELGLGFTDITQILITHMHADHYGLSAKVKELSNATIALHRLEEEFINSRYAHMETFAAEVAQWLTPHGLPKVDLDQFQRALSGEKRLVSAVMPDITLKGGEKIPAGSYNFEVVWTPGHSQGHVCLYDQAKKILLSGDHVLPTIFSNISYFPQSGDNPLGDYFDSLEIVEQLDVDLVLPSHEETFTNLRERIQEIRQHHLERRDAILEVLNEGANQAYKIAERIPWILNGVTMSFAELPPLDMRLAVMATLAQLEKLRIDGIAEKNSADDIILYGILRT